MAPRARAGHARGRLTARAATVDLAVNAQDRNVPSGEPTAAEDVAGIQKTPVPQITLINKRDVPALMSTRIALDSAGKLVSDRSECLMVTGTAERAFARSASPGVSRRGNGGVSWAPVVEFAAGAKKAHAQFQRQTLEAIHAAAAAENAD